MYYYDPYVYRSFAQDQLIANIARAVNGQYTAIACYERLANMAPNQEEKEQIMEIRNDEIRHFRTFSQIYASLTGRQPSYQIVEQCPSEYREGLLFAFKDEQKTADFYQDIAEQAPHPYIKEQFRRASADEQNHAVWFLYFLTRR